MSRHKLIVAVMVPFLAIGGYIAAGYYADDQPPPMRTLELQNECRLVGEACVLKSAGLELRISADQKLAAGQSVNIEINSSSELDDALISFANKDQESRPHRLNKKENNQWKNSVFIENNVDVKQVSLRLIVGWQGNIYFADEKIKQ